MNRLRNGSIAVGAPGSPARIAAEAADNALDNIGCDVHPSGPVKGCSGCAWINAAQPKEQP